MRYACRHVVNGIPRIKDITRYCIYYMTVSYSYSIVFESNRCCNAVFWNESSRVSLSILELNWIISCDWLGWRLTSLDLSRSRADFGCLVCLVSWCGCDCCDCYCCWYCYYYRGGLWCAVWCLMRVILILISILLSADTNDIEYDTSTGTPAPFASSVYVIHTGSPGWYYRNTESKVALFGLSRVWVWAYSYNIRTAL